MCGERYVSTTTLLGLACVNFFFVFIICGNLPQRSTSTSVPHCHNDSKFALLPGEHLFPDKLPRFICSSNRHIKFGYDGNGDVSLWHVDRKVWSVKTYGKNTYMIMQGDGNLVLHGDGAPLWSTKTDGYVGSVLTVDDFGQARVHKGSLVFWETDSMLSSLPLQRSRNNSSSPKLDFFIAGFPKCGTTTLQFQFRRHNETTMPSRETCHDWPNGVKKALSSIPHRPSSTIKYGIKCPMAIWNMLSIKTLVNDQATNGAKLIVGVRHPIHFFQSFYNYRVKEVHIGKRKSKTGSVPPAESLIGVKNEWENLSSDLARYEISLMQLGKVQLTKDQICLLVAKGMDANTTVSFPTFLYSIEQLRDGNESRASAFRREMQHFLGLGSPIEPFPLRNINEPAKKSMYPGTIDICEPCYNELRALLLKQSIGTRHWILESFVKAKGVVVGGYSHFQDLLTSWEVDPC